MQAKGVASMDLDAISGNLYVGILRARAVNACKYVGANIRGALGKDDARAGGLNGNVPRIAGHVPVELVVVLEETQRIGNRIFDGDFPRGIVGIRNINFQLAVMALAAAFVLKRAAAAVQDAFYVEKQRVIQPLRRNILDRNRSIKAVPRTSDKVRLNGFSDIDRTVRRDDDFSLKSFDEQFARAESRSGRKNKSKNERDC